MRIFFALVLSAVAIISVDSPDPAAAIAPPTGVVLLTDGVSGLDSERGTAINSSIWAMDGQDGMLFVGGPFTDVVDRSSWNNIDHRYLAAFDEGTGEYLSWFRTQPDGPVYEIVALGNERILIVGEFTTVNGRPNTGGAAIINTRTGAVDPSFKLKLDSVAGNSGRINDVAISGNWLYVGGNFLGLTGGANNTHIQASRVARVNLATGQPDPTWTPTASGGGVWGIAVSQDGQRVHIGGRFSSMNFDGSAALLATVNTANDELTPGWNNGLPHAQPYPGYVYAVEIAPQGQLIVAGKPHFYAILDSATGAILRDVSVSADAQTIDVEGDSILIGCHCSNDEKWLRQVDANTFNEVWATSNVQGRSGVFAASTRPDQCVYGGGELTQAVSVGGISEALFDLMLFCPPGTSGTSVATATAPVQTDTTAPSVPAPPTVSARVASSIRLSWSPATDNSGDVSYLVLRNGAIVGSTGGTTFYDPKLSGNQSYDWQVVAVDMAGNQSGVSGRSQRVALGSRTNIAFGKSVSQSTTRDFYNAERAIDGNTSGSFAIGSIAVTRQGDRHVAGSWWQIDLGQVTGVEQVKAYPHTDVGGGTAHLNWIMRGYYSNTPITEPTFFQAASAGYTHFAGPKSPPAGTTRIEQFDLNDSFRYMRIYAGESTELEIAEVEIFTVPSSINPTPRTTDLAAPVAPTWKKTETVNGRTNVRFGGATDNVAVVSYEIYKSNVYLGTTSTNDWWIAEANLLANQLTVVSRDASGNSSPNRPGAPVDPPINPPACEIIRSGGAVTVSWSNLNAADKVIIERSVNEGPFWWRGRVEDPAIGQFVDSDRAGAALVYQVKTLTGFAYGQPVPCLEDTPPPPPVPASCSVSRNGTNAVVTWSNVVWDEVTIHRSVNGGTTWWRGRQATTGAGTFTDSDRPGTSLSYEVQPVAGHPDPAIICS